jgi:hypothetical protein
MEDSHDGVLDSGMFGDRCTTWSGNAVIAAAEDAKSKLAEVAADMLDAKAEDLVFRDKKIFAKETPEEAISFLRAVRNAYYGVGKSLYGSGSWSFPGAEIADFSQGYWTSRRDTVKNLPLPSALWPRPWKWRWIRRQARSPCSVLWLRTIAAGP